jgi:hypothetical protein
MVGLLTPLSTSLTAAIAQLQPTVLHLVAEARAQTNVSESP